MKDGRTRRSSNLRCWEGRARTEEAEGARKIVDAAPGLGVEEEGRRDDARMGRLSSPAAGADDEKRSSFATEAAVAGACEEAGGRRGPVAADDGAKKERQVIAERLLPKKSCRSVVADERGCTSAGRKDKAIRRMNFVAACCCKRSRSPGQSTSRRTSFHLPLDTVRVCPRRLLFLRCHLRPDCLPVQPFGRCHHHRHHRCSRSRSTSNRCSGMRKWGGGCCSTIAADAAADDERKEEEEDAAESIGDRCTDGLGW
jgi:hypothetical protein